jgi:outer membrane lipoprotein-sorting protein
MSRLNLVAALLLCSTTARAADPTVEELLDATDDVARAGTSIVTMTMQVKTSRYERTVRMKAWSEGEDKSLVVIEAPEKEKGVATLMVDDQIWNYLPKVDRTMKLPASMMSGSWMGSHVTNDDLIKSSRLADDFTATVTGRPTGTTGNWTIDLVPKSDAAIVWGKVSVRVQADRMPLDIRYYDEKGTLVRTMAFEDVRDVGGRRMPARMVITPADKPGEQTSITYDEATFDVVLPPETFTLQSLKR